MMDWLLPTAPEEMVETPECPTPGCRGLGHVKGAKYVSHHTTVSCPYSPQNLNKDGLIPDRILSKTDQGESKEETISKERRWVQQVPYAVYFSSGDVFKR